MFTNKLFAIHKIGSYTFLQEPFWKTKIYLIIYSKEKCHFQNNLIFINKVRGWLLHHLFLEQVYKSK